MAGNAFIGIEIGGTKLQVMVADESLRVMHTVREPVQVSEGAVGIQRQLESMLAKVSVAWRPLAIGVGFGGPVNYATGKILTSHQVAGWSGVDLKHWLESVCNAPVSVDNDANVAALGEAVYGAGAAVDRMFYVTLGSGVGGGMIVDKEIYHGAAGGEAEIGQLKVDRAGTTLESCCSGWAVDLRVRNVVRDQPKSALAVLAGAAVAGEASFLSQALAQHDAAAQNILTETADALAFGLSHAVHLFHPDMIVIGGGLSLVGAPLIDALQKQMPSYIMHAFLPGPHIVAASLGENVVPRGALELARRTLVSD